MYQYMIWVDQRETERGMCVSVSFGVSKMVVREGMGREICDIPTTFMFETKQVIKNTLFMNTIIPER